MKDIFGVLNGVCEEYNWYISDIELNCSPPEELKHDQQFVNGELLKKIIAENDMQFIWAVFSAFPKGEMPIIEEIPYANGNKFFWVGSPSPQIKNASFEIVCFDSSLFLLIGIPESIGHKFKAKYTDSIDLDVYNQKRVN